MHTIVQHPKTGAGHQPHRPPAMALTRSCASPGTPGPGEMPSEQRSSAPQPEHDTPHTAPQPPMAHARLQLTPTGGSGPSTSLTAPQAAHAVLSRLINPPHRPPTRPDDRLPEVRSPPAPHAKKEGRVVGHPLLPTGGHRAPRQHLLAEVAPH